MFASALSSACCLCSGPIQACTSRYWQRSTGTCMHCCYSNSGVVSTLLSLRDWRRVSKVPDQHRQIAVDRRATPSIRAEFWSLCCCGTSSGKQAAFQSIAPPDALPTSRRRLLLGAASVLSGTGKPNGLVRPRTADTSKLKYTMVQVCRPLLKLGPHEW